MNNAKKSKYAVELNKLQDATLDAISTARDQIEVQFSNHAEDRNLVDYTLKRLFAYMSDRSQAVSYLVSSDFMWDAEIVLRSFYEASAKIWLICLSPPDQRESLAEEFWGAYASMHNHKKAKRASPAAELFKRHDRVADETILSTLADRRIYDFGEGNKNDRKVLEQKWSFSEIIRFLEKNSPDDFDLQDAPGLLHMYGRRRSSCRAPHRKPRRRRFVDMAAKFSNVSRRPQRARPCLKNWSPAPEPISSIPTTTTG